MFTNEVLLVFAGLTVACYGQNYYCGARECVNQTLSTNGDVTSEGYKSNYGPLTNITADHIYLRGAFAMTKAQYMESTAAIYGSSCSGDSSCSQVKELVASNLFCYSMNSCSHIEDLKTSLQCTGELSCAYSTIRGSGQINGLGSFSLMNTNIFSNGGIRADFEGYYAGFNATLTCNSGDSCVIVCAGSGCGYLKIISESGSSINVICSESNGKPCPIIINSNSNNSDYQSSIPNEIPWYSDDEDQSQLSNKMDEICENAINNNSINHIVYDDYQQGLYESITSANNIDVICGRGWDTFVGSSNLVSNDYIICTGYYSCSEIAFISTNVLYCATYQSCRNWYSNSIINVTGTVYCLGMQSCANQNFYNSEAIYVGGTSATAGSNFYAIGKIIVAAYHYASTSQNNYYSSGVDTHIILLSGSHTSYFVCNVTDSCRIDCLVSNACNSFTVECDGYCTIRCDDSAGLDCPGNITGNYEIIAPTQSPTNFPTVPTSVPTRFPTIDPTSIPTNIPTIPTGVPTDIPTFAPTVPTQKPFDMPTNVPITPTSMPTNGPSDTPTASTINVMFNLVVFLHVLRLCNCDCVCLGCLFAIILI